MMKDSTLDWKWVQDILKANPPCVRKNGIIFSGPVRLTFVFLMKPKPGQARNDGTMAPAKYSCDIHFPVGADLAIFNQVWVEQAKVSFPKNWDDRGQPVGLHSPFHDGREKAFSAKPLAGYTPGSIYMSVGANLDFPPACVNSNGSRIVDEAALYSGVWAFVGLRPYKYDNLKKGVGFGLVSVMKIADDKKLTGGGGDPTKDFAGVQISAQSNIAAQFDAIPAGGPATAAPASVMPSGAGAAPATMATQPLPVSEDLSELM